MNVPPSTHILEIAHPILNISLRIFIRIIFHLWTGLAKISNFTLSSFPVWPHCMPLSRSALTSILRDWSQAHYNYNEKGVASPHSGYNHPSWSPVPHQSTRLKDTQEKTTVCSCHRLLSNIVRGLFCLAFVLVMINSLEMVFNIQEDMRRLCRNTVNFR